MTYFSFQLKNVFPQVFRGIQSRGWGTERYVSRPLFLYNFNVSINFNETLKTRNFTTDGRMDRAVVLVDAEQVCGHTYK